MANSYIGKIDEVTVNIFVSHSPYRVTAFLFIFKFTQGTMKKYSVEDTCHCFINLTAFNSLWGKEKEDKC
jgi:hypothetical protein